MSVIQTSVFVLLILKARLVKLIVIIALAHTRVAVFKDTNYTQTNVMSA